MKSILAVEAISPTLSGIGRYVWELSSRLPNRDELDSVRFYRQGRWVDDPAIFLRQSASWQGGRWKLPLPRRLREWGMAQACCGKVFHGPNYFLPSCADVGVMTVHDLSIFKFPETHPAERIREFERTFEDSLMRARHLITDSESTRLEVMEFLGWPADRITAVPLGVGEVFAPREGAELQLVLNKYGLTAGKYTLCVSTLEPRKRIDNLLKAYRALPGTIRDCFPLVLVGGKGWLSEDLHAEIERLTADGWLLYFGFVPESDLPLLYAGARLFVYPSSYEGFGLPVLEAMASGVPVVAANRASLPEVSRGAALLPNPDDISDLKGCIETGLEDEAWRMSTQEKGLAVARQYTWDRCVEGTVQVYRKALG